MKKSIKITLVIIGGIIISLAIFLIIRTNYEPDPDRSYIYDEDGRIMILHGMNVLTSGKSHPLRTGDLVKEDILRLSRDWGYNAVRLLIFWDGIEPQKGKYDYDYLNRVKERLDWCEEAGLKVILDMHQDLYAVRYGGDGAPEWAIIDDNEPFESQSPWELNYFQPAVQASISNFWDIERGHGELQEHYINAIVEALKVLGNHPTVIGVELYNEPTLATFDGFRNLEEKFLTPFYQKAINKIRTVDNDIWIFYEPSAFGPNQGFKSSLGLLNDPRKGDAKLVYFPHIYTLDLDVNGKYMGNPFHINLWADARQKEYKKQNVPMLIGEFGLGGNDPLALEYIEEVLKMSDKICGGWFYWEYDPGSWSIIDKNRNEVKKAKVLERPYPQRIAGSSPKYSWDSELRVFSFEMNWDKKLSEKLTNHWTEIYLPDYCWPKGWILTEVHGNVEQKFDKESRLLNIRPLKKGKINIEITSKN
ncbi:MAG: cellulase family glycosylhydrolase [Bacteroidota bacterium]